MTKYYKVYLYETVKDCPTGQYAICTNYPFSNTIFKEVITGKKIYPNGTYKKVTYSNLYWGCKISATEVEEWLQNMDKESLKEYIDTLNKLEEDAIKHYEERKQYVLELQNKEKITKKNVKKNLRKMRIR